MSPNSGILLIGNFRDVSRVDEFDVFYYYPAPDGCRRSLILDDGVHPNPKGFDVMVAA